VGQALGAVLPLAVAIAIFPVPIIAVVLLVGSESGLAKGLAFVAAWCAGLAAVGAVVLLFAGIADAGESGEPATWVDVLLLVLGLLALAAAVQSWRGRPRAGGEAPVPGWMRAIDGFTTAKAGGAGFALAAVNPKNLLLAVAAAAEIAEFGLPAGEEAAVLVVFVLIASAGVLTPLVLTLALGGRSRALLDGLRGWMARNSAVIMAVLLLLIGAKLIGDALSGFSS
jgi:threonine/homoserine/homoserine lactone efflux protein